MKKNIAVISALLLFAVNSVLSQTNFKDYTAGHQFNISLPDYMTKTIGLNSDATIQFKNNVKDIAGFVIEDALRGNDRKPTDIICFLSTVSSLPLF